jgi:hypothetical protein
MASPSKKAKTHDDELQTFIDESNTEYERVHLAFENQFWGT